jgi:hypothetical protein
VWAVDEDEAVACAGVEDVAGFLHTVCVFCARVNCIDVAWGWMVIARVLGKNAVGEASLDGQARVLVVAELRGQRGDIPTGDSERASRETLSRGWRWHFGETNGSDGAVKRSAKAKVRVRAPGDGWEGRNDIPRGRGTSKVRASVVSEWYAPLMILQ